MYFYSTKKLPKVSNLTFFSHRGFTLQYTGKSKISNTMVNVGKITQFKNYILFKEITMGSSASQISKRIHLNNASALDTICFTRRCSLYFRLVSKISFHCLTSLYGKNRFC